MQQFEIKIFANPSGFQELKLNNSDNLFAKEIVEKRNFDGDYGTFKDGTFSVLFTPKAFIIDYIFNVVADAGFRDPQTHIAIAIERGYILKDAYQVFTNLRKEFNLIAAESKVNITRTLYNKTEVFNKIVEDNLEFALDQFRISTGEIDVTKRALASYETEEQLNSLLEEPNRLKFSSYSLVYFLKKIDASELYKKESIRKYYSGIPMDDSDFNFHASYEVVFPDNYSITITSRSEVIDHTCNKLYYKSERFYGTLNEHMQDWEVTQSEDRTRFIIGKELIPEKKELRILCYDSRRNLINIPPSLKFDDGKLSHQRGILVLTGAEIGVPSLKYHYDDPSIEIKYLEKGDDFISFEIIKLYPYNVSKVFDFVRKETGEIITEIKLYRIGNRVPLATLTKQNPCHYTKTSPDNIEYEIPEIKKYSSVRAGFSNNCAPKIPQFQKKDTANIEFIIKDESIVKSLEKKTVLCFFRTADEENKENKENKYLHNVAFKEDGHLILKELTFGDFSYKINISGYKSHEKIISLYSKDKLKQIELIFEKTPLNKTLGFLNKYKSSVVVFFIGIAVGFFLRPYIIQHEGTDNRTLMAENEALRDSVSILKNDTTNLHKTLYSLENQITALDSINKVLLKTKGSQASAIGQVAAEVNGQPSKLQQQDAHPNEIKRIIQLLNKDKGDVKKPGTFTHRQYYMKLSASEKDQIEQVLNHPAYPTTTIPANITTISDAVKYLNSKMNG